LHGFCSARPTSCWSPARAQSNISVRISRLQRYNRPQK